MIEAIISGLVLGGILYISFFAMMAFLAAFTFVISSLPWGLILTISLIILAAIISVIIVYKIIVYFASRPATRNFIERLNRTLEKKPRPLRKKGRVLVSLLWTMLIILGLTFWLKERYPSTALDNWAFTYLFFIHIPSVLILGVYLIKNRKTL
ncbi:MAG: hypothetical protein Q4G54_12030 [Pelistega sp.]|nr:hypothetical protein [Pelistega sp.]